MKNDKVISILQLFFLFQKICIDQNCLIIRYKKRKILRMFKNNKKQKTTMKIICQKKNLIRI